jgi:hypothetical protein
MRASPELQSELLRGLAKARVPVSISTIVPNREVSAALRIEAG